MRDTTDTEAAAEQRQRAEDAAAAHLRAAVGAVDAAFGDGYARAHPELVASLVQASALESIVEAGRESSAEALATVSRLSRETNETLLRLKPRLF